MKQRSSRYSGFTLLEILVVSAVIGVLVSIAIPLYSRYRAKSNDAVAVTDIQNMKVSLESYFLENKYYPF